eukprot:UN09697
MALLLLLVFIITIFETNGRRRHSLLKRNTRGNQYHQMNHQHRQLQNQRPHLYTNFMNRNHIYEYNSKNVKYGEALEGDVNSVSDKSQKKAFLLSLFFFGAGRIYVGHFIVGSIQLFLIQSLLILMGITTIFSCFFKSGSSSLNEERPRPPTANIRQLMLLSIFWVPLALIVFIWWIHDIASFAMNNITDANGLPLQPW